ncbi:MAG: hypothetical protein ACRDBI_06255, partial [Shewanella sp.]
YSPSIAQARLLFPFSLPFAIGAGAKVSDWQGLKHSAKGTYCAAFSWSNPPVCRQSCAAIVKG